MDAPVVAAVHGVCAGGMSAFVAGADILIAAQDAKFVAAYPGIGFSCDAGSSIMYARRLGVARARSFMLLNESLGAEAQSETRRGGKEVGSKMRSRGLAEDSKKQ